MQDKIMKMFWLLLFISCIAFHLVSSSPCHRRTKRCTMPECDLTGALSMCAPNTTLHCPDNHDDVETENICSARGMRCCRSICNGTGTFCMPKENPCLDGYEQVQGNCPLAVNDRYKCCAPKLV